MTVPRRVVVTSPRTTAARPRRRPVTQEINDQTGVGDAYMRSLLRSQLRLALVVLALLGLVGGLLPLLFATVPAIGEADVFGVDLPWLVLGVLVYPLLLGLGWFYVRHAEQTEQEFEELIDLAERQ